MRRLIVIAAIYLLLGACGGGSGSTGENQSFTARYKLQHTIALPAHYLPNDNVLLDKGKLILAGSEKGFSQVGVGLAGGAHPADNKEVVVIDISSGAKSVHTMNVGRGFEANIINLGNGKYVIAGGYKNVESIEILDINTNTLSNIPINVSIADSVNGLYTTNFFTGRNAGAAVGTAGDRVGFFGFDVTVSLSSGTRTFYHAEILLINVDTKQVSLSNVALTAKRSQATAHTLTDGRVLVVGGNDGTSDESINSASRRAEIYDPVLDAVTRVSDYPEKLLGQVRDSHYLIESNNAEICIKSKQYTIASDSWSDQCTLPSSAPEIQISDMALSAKKGANNTYFIPTNNEGDVITGTFIGKGLNGELIFMNGAAVGNEFDQACQCKPFTSTPNVYVFAPN